MSAPRINIYIYILKDETELKYSASHFENNMSMLHNCCLDTKFILLIPDELEGKYLYHNQFTHENILSVTIFVSVSDKNP